jgi:hypothetical protein
MTEVDNPISLQSIIQKTKAKKIYILLTVLISFALSCAIILPVPRYYHVDVELAPENETSANNSSIGNIASSLGFDIGGINGTDAISPNIYPELLKSNNFIYDLLNCRVKTLDNKIDTTYYQYLLKYQKANPLLVPFKNISRHFSKKEDIEDPPMPKNIFLLNKGQTAIFNAIRDNIGCSIDIKTNLITISVEDQDPLVAAIIADSINTRLQKFITKYRTGKARKDYAYYKKLTAQAKAKYEKSRDAYSRYSDNNTDPILQSVRSNIEDMENDMQLKFNAYSALNNQLQAAHAKILENTPAFTVIKSPTVPVKPAGPKRMAFVVAMVLLSLIGCLFYINRDLLFSSLKRRTI